MDWKTFIAETLKAISWPVLLLYLAHRFHKPLFSLLAKLASVKSAEVLGTKLLFDDEIKLVAKAADDLPLVGVTTIAATGQTTVAVPLDPGSKDSPIVDNDRSNGQDLSQVNNLQNSPTVALQSRRQLTLDLNDELLQLERLVTSEIDIKEVESKNYGHLVVLAWNLIESSLRKILSARDVLMNSNRNSANAKNVLREVTIYRLLPEEHLEVLRNLKQLRNQAIHAQSIGVGRESALSYLKSTEAVLRAIAATPVSRRRAPLTTNN
jgi:hypothetical protein